ncbi:50S ribosomal protein L18 [Candidatus Woesearchaeota archaeon]|jgi:large subunit ribosomal protein L18|nr:50S ribosomal protein L18 [Candidatus Woesearchaeota archaeon]MBT4321720.1 50S ribosomal protein L18 [Candidatus Woesearchaeota archaeon]MBT4631188.1 50S ribosomal protein L18 [Candidatus Woesearchaeota archaeon]
MSRNKIYTVPFKRKIKGKTDYNKRLKYLKSGKVRIIIRSSKNSLLIQGVNFQEEGDKVLCSTKSSELKKMGWKYNLGNIPSAYLVGLYFGTKNKDKIKEAIIDLGLKSITKGDRLSAAIKGIADSGIKIPHSDSIFPKENKINGSIIVEYAKSLSSNKEEYEKQFSKYLKDNIKPENITEEFEKTKKTILDKK